MRADQYVLSVAVGRGVHTTLSRISSAKELRPDSIRIISSLSHKFDPARPRLPQVQEAVREFSRTEARIGKASLLSVSAIGVVDHRRKQWLKVPREEWRFDNFQKGIPFGELLGDALPERLHRRDAILANNDVVSIALVEGTHGETSKLLTIPATFALVALRSGVNAVIVANGEPIVGRCNPEFGHVITELHERDVVEFKRPDSGFRGLCEAHRWGSAWCLEGLIGQDTFHQRKWLSELPASGRRAAEDEAIGWYLSQLCYTLVLAAAPACIVIAGSRATTGVLRATRSHLKRRLGNYPSYTELRQLSSFIRAGALEQLDKHQIIGSLLAARNHMIAPNGVKIVPYQSNAQSAKPQA